MALLVRMRDAESAKGKRQFVLSQCVFDGSQRFSLVLQCLLQLPEGAVSLLGIEQDLLEPQNKSVFVYTFAQNLHADNLVCFLILKKGNNTTKKICKHENKEKDCFLDD